VPHAGRERHARRLDRRRTPWASERTHVPKPGVNGLGDSAERESSRRWWGKDLTNWQMGRIWR